MKTFPELITKRLILRNVQLNDIPAILKYANNKVISDNVLNIPFPYNEEEVLYWIKKAHEGFRNNTRYAFAITLKELGELIGVISLSIEQDHNKAELGFWVGEPYWGRGIMTEATEEILKFGFNEVNLNKIFATHYVNNEASGKVLSKSGMKKEGVLKDHYLHKNIYKTVIQYRMTKEEYVDRKSNKFKG
jgi:RimJ/RimL family protein N-acetyltransferase